MKNHYDKNAVSSYGLKYFIDKNICEINEFYDSWDKLGYIYLFIEIL